VQVRNAAAQIFYSQTVSHRRQEEIFLFPQSRLLRNQEVKSCYLAGMRAMTTLNLFRKQRTALQFHSSLSSLFVRFYFYPRGNRLLEEASLGWR
jgi:hypothetical protein